MESSLELLSRHERSSSGYPCLQWARGALPREAGMADDTQGKLGRLLRAWREDIESEPFPAITDVLLPRQRRKHERGGSAATKQAEAPEGESGHPWSGATST